MVTDDVSELEYEEEEEVIQPGRLVITYGDITLMPVREGAIVNPSNTGMILNAGVGLQIARRAGPFIQQTLHMARSGLRQGRLDPGQAIDTEPGQLPCKRLIHVAIVGARRINNKLISRSILNVIDHADELELPRIAMPPIGVETARFNLEEFLDLFWRITSEELPRMNHLHEIVLVAPDEESFERIRAFAAEHVDELHESIELIVSESGISMDMLGGL